MTEAPLFYRKIVPLNAQAHGDLRLDVGPTRFGFAAGTHLIPAVVDEFVAAAHSLPIVFLPGPGQPTAIFLVGTQPKRNRFVDPDGRWTGAYVPAYLRRYPFIIGDVAEGEPLACIDEEADCLRGDGEALFETGEPTPPLTAAIRFINDFLAAAKRTDTLIAALVRLDLFRGVTVDIKAPSGASQTMHGLLVVDMVKLDGLADDAFLDLRRDGLLAAIYAHAGSLAELQRLQELHDIAPETEPSGAR